MRAEPVNRNQPNNPLLRRRELPRGNLQERRVEVQQEGYLECFKCFKSILSGCVNWWHDRPYHQTSFFENPSHHISAINPRATVLTNTCIDQLKAVPASSHQAIVRKWVEAIYGAHGINLSADQGGHMIDMMALSNADSALNPFILKELERLVPHSEEARRLSVLGTRQGSGSISSLIYQ